MGFTIEGLLFRFRKAAYYPTINVVQVRELFIHQTAWGTKGCGLAGLTDTW